MRLRVTARSPGLRSRRQTAQLTLDVGDEPALEWPLARLDGAWITLGFGDDLESAGIRAMEGMLALMKREVGVEGPTRSRWQASVSTFE